MALATFANPWHDEIGRFAPKGSGRRFDVDEVRALAATAREAVQGITLKGSQATPSSTAATEALMAAGRPIYDAALASLDPEHAQWFDREWVNQQYGPQFSFEAQQRANEAMTAAVLDLIREVRPGFGEGTIKTWAVNYDEGSSTVNGGTFTTVNPATVDAVSAAAEYFPAEWLDGVGIGVAQTKGTSIAWAQNGIVHLPTWRSDGIPQPIVVHEVTHILDEYNYHLLKAGLAFLAQRKTDYGGRLKTHSQVGGDGTRNKAVDDSFKNPYTGAFYGSTIESSDGSEALSTQMQELVEGSAFRLPHSSTNADQAWADQTAWLLGTLVSV